MKPVTLKKTSTRNRHTGRINAAKAAILKRQKRAQTVDGRVYAAAEPRTNLITGLLLNGQMVRDFAAEKEPNNAN